MLALCDELGRRAREAAARGEPTFAVPEAAAAAAFIAATIPAEQDLRAEAERWAAVGASYHALVRLAARAAVALDGGQGTVAGYRAKAGAELEPMLDLWPDVLVLPVAARLSSRDLIQLRSFPVHPLGLVPGRTWADGGPLTPSEYFFHDLDHARFKVREGLLAHGLEMPDAYQAGSTLDPSTGCHRAILWHARGRIGDRLWQQAAQHRSLAGRLLAFIDRLGDATLAASAELLLFELIHEKSLPLDAGVLARALAGEAHLAKLRQKQSSGFFDPPVAAQVIAALPAARVALRQALS
jgi:hypothetical protein